MVAELKEEIKEEIKMTYEDAVHLANEIERVEAAAKLMKAKLKKFVEENGQVETKNKVWRMDTSISFGFSKDQMYELAQAIAMEGHSPYHYFTVGSKNIDAIASELNWERSAVEQFGAKKETVKMISRKL